MSKRKLFRRLVTLEEAISRINEAYHLPPLRVEHVPLPDAYGRILAEGISSTIDVPGFDRAMMDGYAVDAKDVFNAREDAPVTLKVKGRIDAGEETKIDVEKGSAIEIATGAPIPRGANAVVMIEYTQEEEGELKVFKPVTPGENIMTAGSDLAVGDVILRQGQMVSSREMGLLSAIGLDFIPVFKRPVVAILSTGGELSPTGEELLFGKIYDVNSYSLMGAIRECGCSPLNLGIIKDDVKLLRGAITRGLSNADIIVSSGSTSAGVGDIIYKVIDEIGKPGVLVHGLALKPGKPTIISLVKEKLVFSLPGYPTAALTIFHLLVRPILLRLAGRHVDEGHARALKARLALRVFSAKGRREFLPVHLIKTGVGAYSAYPILSGSGAITSFSIADGYIDIPSNVELLREGEMVEIYLYDPRSMPVDLAVFGSQCSGIEVLVSLIREKSPWIDIKTINIGSIDGLNTVAKGGSDIAGIHILDDSGEYNLPYIEKNSLSNRVVLIRGYDRMQGFIIRRGIGVLEGGFKDIIEMGLSFINRNSGSGTRILIDSLIGEAGREIGLTFEEASRRIKGYAREAKTHASVASAIKYGRADVGVGIKSFSKHYDLDFIPISYEKFDFAILRERLGKTEIQEFIKAMKSKEFKQRVESELEFKVPRILGEVLN